MKAAETTKETTMAITKTAKAVKAAETEMKVTEAMMTAIRETKTQAVQAKKNISIQKANG